MRQRRTPESRREFFRRCRTANNRSPFEYERLNARPGELERRREAVVAGADDHDRAHAPAPVSFKIRPAALRPEAPMIPPPG